MPNYLNQQNGWRGFFPPRPGPGEDVQRDEQDIDGVTGLIHRAALDRQLASFGRGVFLLIGIERLGAISSAHGPAVAEKLLRATAQAVIGTVRPDDICARYGEDTFCLLLGGAATDKQGRGVAERIRKALLRVRVDEAPPIPVGVTIEVGFVDMGVDAAEEVRRMEAKVREGWAEEGVGKSSDEHSPGRAVEASGRFDAAVASA